MKLPIRTHPAVFPESRLVWYLAGIRMFMLPVEVDTASAIRMELASTPKLA